MTRTIAAFVRTVTSVDARGPDVNIYGTLAPNGPVLNGPLVNGPLVNGPLLNGPLSRVLFCNIVSIETREGTSMILMGAVRFYLNVGFVMCVFVCVYCHCNLNIL